MKIKFKFEGEDEFNKAVKLLEKKASDKLKIAIMQSAIHVEGIAKRTTAWKNVTAKLRPSITHEVTSDGPKHQGRVGTNVFYGKYLEFGTKKMPAHPWLIPALQSSASVILGFLKKAIEGLKP